MTPEAEEGGRGGRLRRIAATPGAFALYSLRRFNADGCFAASGALGYTTLSLAGAACRHWARLAIGVSDLWTGA